MASSWSFSAVFWYSGASVKTLLDKEDFVLRGEVKQERGLFRMVRYIPNGMVILL